MFQVCRGSTHHSLVVLSTRNRSLHSRKKTDRVQVSAWHLYLCSHPLSVRPCDSALPPAVLSCGYIRFACHRAGTESQRDTYKGRSPQFQTHSFDRTLWKLEGLFFCFPYLCFSLASIISRTPRPEKGAVRYTGLPEGGHQVSIDRSESPCLKNGAFLSMCHHFLVCLL